MRTVLVLLSVVALAVAPASSSTTADPRPECFVRPLPELADPPVTKFGNVVPEDEQGRYVARLESALNKLGAQRYALRIVGLPPMRFGHCVFQRHQRNRYRYEVRLSTEREPLVEARAQALYFEEMKNTAPADWNEEGKLSEALGSVLRVEAAKGWTWIGSGGNPRVPFDVFMRHAN